MHMKTKQVTIQVDKPEIKKALDSKSFIANVQTRTHVGGGTKITKPRKPKGMPTWFKEWTQNEFKPLVTTVKQQGEAIQRIETRLDRQDEFNQQVLTRFEKIESRS